MEIIQFAIVIIKTIAAVAAYELNNPSCQRQLGARQHLMRQGYHHTFYRDPKRDHVYRGGGSAYRNQTTGSYLTCARMCLWDDACKSFNYCLDDKHCELNSVVFSNMTDLLFAKGCLYYDEEYHEPQGLLVNCSDPQPLGLEERTIPDERLTASDVRSGYPASAGRLNNPDGFWWQQSNEIDPWIEVDLGEPTVVHGVITQGEAHESNRVKKYKVSFKKDRSSSLEHVTDANGDIKVFDGNVNNPYTPITNMFHQSIIAVAVRVEPVEWDGCSMRLELLGCYITRKE